jgi:aspartyl-tRNA(Asn)/glutamyl-tRNA(Gln) amidotransferase subunit A
MTMTALHDLTIAQASSAIAKREISPVDLTRALIDRITEYDGGIHSFITLTPDLALQQAKIAEHEVFRGNRRSALCGIPFALKDVYDTANIPTTGHSKVFQNRVPNQDSECARRLLAAGGILMGKLATHEMAHGGPSFDLPWPPARNPWNTSYFTGGSSSGSGAAIAARFIPAACGTDTGGSIRGPASLCGISGFMPTAGLISRLGVIPNSSTLDRCGPMARTVEDCALLMQVLAGHDATTNGPLGCDSDIDYTAALLPHLRGKRIGVVRTYWEEETQQPPEVIVAIEEALSTLKGLGAEIEDTSWLPLRDALDVKIAVGQPEIFSVHAEALRRDPSQFGADFQQRVLPACLFTANDFLNARLEHQRMKSIALEAFKRYDALVTISQGTAPLLAAHKPIDYWRRLNTYAPANVSGGPALVACAGFSGGLPVGMQIIGKPHGDLDVLRIGYAFQQATDWHSRSPLLAQAEDSLSVALPHSAECPPWEKDSALSRLCESAALRAGLSINESLLDTLYQAAPFVFAISKRLATR